MSLSSSAPFLRESPFSYAAPPPKNVVYEISLRANVSSSWLKDLPGAHRLVQALLQGQLLGKYELLDFLIWPEGLFTRVSLKGAPSLAGFLKFLKERTIPAGEPSGDFWDEELQWIMLVPPERMAESTRDFLHKADRLRLRMNQSRGFSPNLFFFYRNSRLTQ
jgi:hypothetical protein